MAPQETSETEGGNDDAQDVSQVHHGQEKPKSDEPSWFPLYAFVLFLVFDVLSSLLLLSPLIPQVEHTEGASNRYSLYRTLWDLGILTILRVTSALFAILYGFFKKPSSELRPELFHDKGTLKSRIELEEEALEEPLSRKLLQYIQRPAFLCEFMVFLTGALLAVKCLVRLNVEIVSSKHVPKHPVFWIVLCITGFCSFVTTIYIDQVEKVARECGQAYRERREFEEETADDNSNNLTEPLLPSTGSQSGEEGDEIDDHDDDIEQAAHDVEQGGQESRFANGDVRGHSNIRADASYKAKFSDLLEFCAPDRWLMLLAFLFLLGAALANVYIPRFTGNVLDALIAHAKDGSNEDDHSITYIPGFVSNIVKLTIAAVLGGIFGGCRGAIFTMVGARVNVRLRVRLMDSLLIQDIGFFDTTRTGDITSRLGSDTTLVGSSITSSVSVFLRSTVRAVCTLICMFLISWQLSLLAFLTIPAVSIISKWYGRFIRSLARLQQKKLADGNHVSESTIASMPTVRAFGAELAEMVEFGKCMEKYMTLTRKAAIATLGYGTCVDTLPEIVKALVLYYGGLLIQTGAMSGGQLVSFILYLSALAEAFNSLAGTYASLTRAMGGADKVFELLQRKPAYKSPSHIDPERVAESIDKCKKQFAGLECTKIAEERVKGMHPEVCAGEITLNNVEMCYPARPQRVVLEDLSMTIPSGSIVALVGASGSGKSTIVSLIQHLYEPTKGEVCIDGTSVHELSPEWMSQNVAVVMQEPALFARSVRRNIIFGLEGSELEPTQEEVEASAMLANAVSFIEHLPRGYDTDVGERGIQLSGGQKQRLAIARALVRKPTILILDEATSALDAISENVVQQAIDDMLRGQRSLDGDPKRSMTVVIIAHRLSTIRNVDRIFVLDEGKIQEEGSHSDLMSMNGTYASLVRKQVQPFPNSESEESLMDLSQSYIEEAGM